MAGINKGKGIAMAMPYRRLRCYKFIKEKKSGYQKVYLLTFPLIPPSPSFFLKNFVQKVQAKACNPVGLVVLLTWKSGYQKVRVYEVKFFRIWAYLFRKYADFHGVRHKIAHQKGTSVIRKFTVCEGSDSPCLYSISMPSAA